MKPIDSASLEINSLISLFYDNPDALGQLSGLAADQVPPPSHELLVHEHHMTVTVEKHYQSEVDVQVLQARVDSEHYSRKILLSRQSDGLVVQFGIVRLNMSVLNDKVQTEISSQGTPLGRILINNNVLREVKLLGLCKIVAGDELANHFGLEVGTEVYGRSALIYCDGNPAIELLEVVRG